MVTLVGIGGSGKTRLSLEAAARLISGFPGGAWLVELAPLSDPAELVRAIAEVLSIPGQAERDLLDVVSDAIANVASHPARARQLRARRPSLRIPGDPPADQSFAPPRAGHQPPATVDSRRGHLAGAPPRRRHRRRGVVSRPWPPAGPDLTDLDDHQAVADICRHLDGLPLAIELAAAQVQAFDPADIAARLGDRFRLLQRPTAESDRHRNLRATIAWSHDLLSPAAQIVLRRLAVFIGSFDLSAAKTVCADLHLERG